MITLLFPEGLFALAALCLLLLFPVFTWRHEQEVLRAFLLKARPGIFISELFAVAIFIFFITLTLTRPVLFEEGLAELKLAENTEVLLVFDVSRSMLAQKEPYAPMRLDRAKVIAKDLTGKLKAKIGIAGFTDVMMAHLLPGTDLQALNYVIERTVQVESVPFNRGRGSLDSIMKGYPGFFDKDTENKIIVIFTDGDMPYLSQNADSESFRRDKIKAFFISIGSSEDRIYTYDSDGRLTGREPYVTEFDDGEKVLQEAAVVVGGKYFNESSSAKLLDAIKTEVGKANIVAEVRESRRAVELTPITALAAFSALMFFFYIRRPR